MSVNLAPNLFTHTHLCPNLQNLLESHARTGEFTLQQHDHIGIVLVNLLVERILRMGSVSLLEIGLQLCYLLVDTGNVLFDDKG